MNIRLSDRDGVGSAVSAYTAAAWTMIASQLALVGMMAVALPFAVLYWKQAGPYWKLTADSTTYVLGAESLARGQGYTEAGAPAQLFPPGTSALLAVGWMAGGKKNYRAMNMEVALFALASVVVCFFLFREALGETGTAAVVLLCLGSAEFFERSSFLLSEIFFIFFSLLAFWTHRRGSTVGTVLSTSAAVMVRSVGACLAVALLFDLFRKRPRRWAQIAGYAIPLLLTAAWEVRNRQLGWSYSELMTQNEPWVRESGRITIGHLLARLIANRSYARPLEAMLTNELTEHIAWTIVPGIIVGGLIALGFRRLTITKANGLQAAGVYSVLFSIAVALYWPEVFVRLFLPLLPLLAAYLVAGVQEAARISGYKWIYAPALGVLGWYLVIGYRADAWLIAHDRRSAFLGQLVIYTGNREMQSIALWWKAHSAQNDRYACQHPNIMNIITSRSGVNYVPARQPETLENGLRSSGARFLFLDMKSGPDRELSRVAERSLKLRLERVEDGARLYEFTP